MSRLKVYISAGAIAILGTGIVLFFVVRPEPPFGAVVKEKTVSELIAGKSEREKANIKAGALAKAGKPQTYHDDTNGFDIEIRSVEQQEGVVQVFARAWKNGERIGFGADGSVETERFRFYNPPVLVPDGTKHIEVNPKGLEVQIDNFKEDPAEALLQILAEAIRVVGKDGSNVVIGKVGNTVDTIYPNSGDDSIFTTQTTWANAWDDTSGTLRGAGTSGYNQAYDGGVNYVIERYFATFDTGTTLPDTDVVSDTVLSLYVLAHPGTPERNTSTYNSSHSDTVAAGDFDLGGTTDWSSDIVRSTATDNAYNDLTFNATGIAGVSTTGLTKVAVRATIDASNSDPGDEVDDPYLQWSKSNTTGTTKDPKLTVTHAAAATGKPGEPIFFD